MTTGTRRKGVLESLVAVACIDWLDFREEIIWLRMHHDRYA